jgi:hypothetical protein
MEKTDIINQDNYTFTVIDDKTFEFNKKQTIDTTKNIWCGFKITPIKVTTIIKFDIQFISDVPNENDNVFLKTHEPVNFYKEWLSKCKTGEFIHIEQPLYLAKKEQLIIFIMDECLKPLHFIIKNIEFVYDEKNYKFISFFTQGPPYDKCFDLTNCANEYNNYMKPYVDSIKFYSASELKNNSETSHLVKEFSSEPSSNPKTNLIGYLRWKPYIILKTLLESNEGDIIYYRDSNKDKYPDILCGIENTVNMLNLVLLNRDLFTPVENYPCLKMKKNVKREVFEYFNMYNKTNLESHLVVSNRGTNYNNLYNESGVIYDNSNSRYLFNVYDVSSAITGNALSLISFDNSSNSFLRIIDPSGAGFSTTIEVAS